MVVILPFNKIGRREFAIRSKVITFTARTRPVLDCGGHGYRLRTFLDAFKYRHTMSANRTPARMLTSILEVGHYLNPAKRTGNELRVYGRPCVIFGGGASRSTVPRPVFSSVCNFDLISHPTIAIVNIDGWPAISDLGAAVFGRIAWRNSAPAHSYAKQEIVFLSIVPLMIYPQERCR